MEKVFRSQVPPRVAFFVWTAAMGRVLTIDNLRKDVFLWWIGGVSVR
jgi:hypothetical protein